MKCSERVDLYKNNGIVLSQHPAVIVTVGISDVTKDLPAGSILSLDETEKWAPWADSAKACGVLINDEKAVKSGEKLFASVLIHGCVNRDRICTGTGASVTAVNSKTVVDLMAHGIYPVQSFDE